MTRTADTTIYTRRESAARSYCRAFPVTFTRAQNATLTDAEGRNYTDFLAGCSSLNYGHNDRDMKAALIEHIQGDGVAHGLDMHTDAKGAFLDAFERLILSPRRMPHKVMFTGPTGTNAVEAAMKLARKTTGRDTIIAFSNGFHGMTLGALAATGNAGKRAGAGRALTGVVSVPYEGAVEGVDSLALLRAMLDNPSSGIDAPAAFLVETVQGEGGLNAASPEFLRGLQELARAHGALMIVDDIQAGIGRTGPFFSFEGMGIMPDLIPLAKSLSGMGLPMAALLIRPDLDVWKPAEHNGTFRGNAHAFVTARVALEKFWVDDAFQRQTEAKAAYLSERLTTIAGRVPGASLRGRGMMQGINLVDGEMAAAVCAACFSEGLIIETSGERDQVVKVLAPLTIAQAQLAEGLDILEAAVQSCLTETRIAAE